MKTSNALIQQLLKAEEEAEQIVHKAKESKMPSILEHSRRLVHRRSESVAAYCQTYCPEKVVC